MTEQFTLTSGKQEGTLHPHFHQQWVLAQVFLFLPLFWMKNDSLILIGMSLVTGKHRLIFTCLASFDFHLNILSIYIFYHFFLLSCLSSYVLLTFIFFSHVHFKYKQAQCIQNCKQEDKYYIFIDFLCVFCHKKIFVLYCQISPSFL